jgi:hypothetical protein
MKLGTSQICAYDGKAHRYDGREDLLHSTVFHRTADSCRQTDGLYLRPVLSTRQILQPNH